MLPTYGMTEALPICATAFTSQTAASSICTVTTIAPIAIAATLTITVVAVRRRQEPHKI